MVQPSPLHRFWLFRRGRRWRFFCWLNLGGLALSVAVLGLAAVANARVPAAAWASVSTLEGSAPPVLTLIQNRPTGVLYASTAGGVFRSRDDGASWQFASTGLTDRVETLAVDDLSGTVYGGTWDGVFRTTDEGEHWLRVADALRGKQVVALTVDATENQVHAGTIDGDIFSARGDGSDWHQIGHLTSAPQRLMAGPSAGELFVATDQEVFRASVGEGGAYHWTDLSHTPGGLGTPAWALDEQRKVLYAASPQGVWQYSSELGWMLAGPPPAASVRAFTLDERTGTLYAGTDSGVFRSQDAGATWQGMPSSPGNANALIFNVRRGILLAATNTGVYRLVVSGVRWETASYGLTGSMVVESLARDQVQGTLYVGTVENGLFRSVDDGATWESTALLERQNEWPEDSPVWKLAIDERRSVIYAGTLEGVYRSSDDGISWEQVGLRNTVIWSLALDAISGALYVGADQANVYRSLDSGGSWERLGVGLPNVAVALVWETKTQCLFAGTARGVFRFDDQAGIWVRSGLAERHIQALVAGNPGYLYAGTDVGVYRSEDGGQSWRAINQGLWSPVILALAGDLDQGLVYAGTRQGVFRLSDDGRWEKWGLQAEAVSISQLSQAAPSQGFYGAGGGQVYRITPHGLDPTNVAFGVPIWGLAVDQRHQAVYAAASSGLERSLDGGQTWTFVSYLPRPGRVLVIDDLQGVMYASDFVDTLSSSDDGQTWQDRPGISIGVPADYLWAWDKRGAVGRWLDGSLIWTGEGMHALWKFPATFLEPRPCLWADLRSGSQITLECGDGASLLRSELATLPLPWLALRLWAWEIAVWLADHAALAAVSVVLALIIMLLWALVRTRHQVSRPFGVPILAAWFAPERLANWARPAALAAAWPGWEKAVRAEAVRYGDVCPVDLETIASPFRRYALKRYAELYADIERLDVGTGQIRLRDERLIRRWQAAAGLVDTQARLFAEALGTSLGEGCNLGWATIYLTEPLNLAGQPPACVRLIWLAEGSVGVYTMQALIDLLKKDAEALTLIVSSTNNDEAEALKQALAWLSPGGRFGIIGEHEVLGLLIAREPLRRLTGLFSKSALSWQPM